MRLGPGREELATLNEQLVTSWGPWWLDALLATFLGFGQLQDHVRRIGPATGWHVAVEVGLALGSAMALAIFAWRAVAKFRVRRRAKALADSG
ncbi:MAG TPA: hypothetical protein VFJ85_06615 [Acidimicrobiales bacterium]|nr:hypothetical protein [Acidimicrobiales bacterium]